VIDRNSSGIPGLFLCGKRAIVIDAFQDLHYNTGDTGGFSALGSVSDKGEGSK